MTTPTPRWTAETEELVARALPRVASWCPDPQCGDSTWDHECQLGGERPDTASARKALTALADAGVLTSPGGETRQEWRVVYRDGRGDAVVWSNELTEEGAVRSLATARGEGWPSASRQSQVITTYPGGTVTTGPWREVTE